MTDTTHQVRRSEPSPTVFAAERSLLGVNVAGGHFVVFDSADPEADGAAATVSIAHPIHGNPGGLHLALEGHRRIGGARVVVTVTEECDDLTNFRVSTDAAERAAARAALGHFLESATDPRQRHTFEQIVRRLD